MDGEGGISNKKTTVHLLYNINQLKMTQSTSTQSIVHVVRAKINGIE